MPISAVLGSGILLALATPPAFDRLPNGEAVDGQRLVHPPSPNRQIIAFVPDRTTGRDWGLRYLREAVSDFNRELPDAVFCVGDLVQGYARDHGSVAQQREVFLNIVGSLSMPFYPTPGNHDLVSGKRDATDRSFADEYRALFGPLYYSVELELASVVILNTEDGDGRIEPGFSDAQLAWLDGELEALAKRNRPMILVMHRPLWDHKPTRWETRVQPLLVKHGVDQVIAGHYHALQALPPRDGIPFLLLGTCGGAVDQHPLAGQLQHVTFVTIDEAGAIKPFHQIAGCTLPVDWITQADQALAFQLKSARDAVTIVGAVADGLGAAASGSVEVTLHNPLDRAVEFVFSKSSAPTPWEVIDRVDGQEITRSWTSRTAFDVFNPWTTDLSTPFSLAFEPARIKLDAGESGSVKISARCAAQATPPEPPPFDIVATYSDSKERRVPVLLRQRFPLSRTVEVASDTDSALPYSIAVWNCSEYDTPERNSTLRVLSARGDAVLRLALTVPDEQLSPDAKPKDTKASLEDPLADAVRLQLGEGPDSREFLVTFTEGSLAPVVRTLTSDRSKLERSKDLGITLTHSGKDWNLAIDVLKGALPPSAELAGLPINLGVADNDLAYHTQWRWLAPKQTPARLRLNP